jgi:hypothetical protein
MASPRPPSNSALKFEAQQSEAYTTTLSTCASFSKQKPKGPAKTLFAPQSNHISENSQSKDGIINILKFMYGQLYYGKLAYVYTLAPTDACPLCGLPNSCIHIAAGECKTHNKFMSKHNATHQLTNATMRTALKGGGTLYSTYDLRLKIIRRK